jgi:hypothetical protein
MRSQSDRVERDRSSRPKAENRCQPWRLDRGRASWSTTAPIPPRGSVPDGARQQNGQVTRNRLLLRSKARQQKGCLQRGYNDTSHEVRCLSAKSVTVIVLTLVYLTSAFRSQGFSPSQRFDPTATSRLCFTPLPPIGFRPPELFPLDQPRSLSACVLSCRWVGVYDARASTASAPASEL